MSDLQLLLKEECKDETDIIDLNSVSDDAQDDTIGWMIRQLVGKRELFSRG
jgi:hypothetical protein